MTLEEAREYLNLPANSREQLIRKRYLELKKQYLKAIYNAPSDHFSSLYQENLQKIEEAYQFLTGGINEVKDSKSQMQHTIRHIQQMVNTFLKDKKVLDSESRKTLNSYIDQVDNLKNTLKKDTLDLQLQVESSQRQAWHWQVDQFKKNTTSEETKPPLPPYYNKQSTLLERLIEVVVGVPYPQSTGGRRHLYDRLLMGTIVAIVILGVLGALYVMFPLFS